MDPFGFFFGGVFGATVFIFSLCLYFLPTIIALARRRHNTVAIFLLNFFLGWTFVGWVVSLVWAVKE